MNQSITMWSSPSTDAERQYYSINAKKRKAYGYSLLVFHAVHVALAYSAWVTLISVVNRFSPVPHIDKALSIVLLVISHYLLSATWQTYWYDHFKNAGKKDSSIWITMLIVLILGVTEWQGAKKFLEDKAPTPLEINNDRIHRKYNAMVDAEREKLQVASSGIESKYAAAEKRIEKRYKQRIAQMRAAGYSEADIAKLQDEQHNALTALFNSKNKDLHAINKASTELTERMLVDYRREVQSTNTKVDHSQQLYANYMNSVNGLSAFISLFIMFAILGMYYARVRINVKSGILPHKQFTPLDKYGSNWEYAFTAASDIVNKRFKAGITAVHKWMLPKKPVELLDGSTYAVQGNYAKIAEALDEDYEYFQGQLDPPSPTTKELMKGARPEPIPKSTQLPPSASWNDEGHVLFQHAGGVFKQIYKLNGNVVAISYDGPKQKDAILSYSSCLNRYKVYMKRKDVVRRDMWHWASAQFLQKQ